MKRMVPVRALALAVCLSLMACGETERVPAPKEVAGPAQRVAKVVEQLEAAIAERDFKAVCDELLTPAARDRSGGKGCAATMRESVEDLRRPRIRVLSINIAGRRAEARIRSRATGQRPVDETLQLERDGRSYRIASLSG
jgi:hypothetical protein